MFSTSLIVILILSVTVVTVFVYFAKIISTLQKRLIESTVKDHDIQDKTVNYDNCTKNEIHDQNIINENVKGKVQLQKSADIQHCNEQAGSYSPEKVGNNGEELDDYIEVSVIKINKFSGAQTTDIGPGKLSLNSPEQFYNLDIVIENNPIDRALKDQRKR